MYSKFIIAADGTLRFGHVYLHRDLVNRGEGCPYGGGLWKRREDLDALLLYGRSFDFGPPELDRIRRVDWSGAGGRPCTLFFLPHWPSEEEMLPVFASEGMNDIK